MSLGATTDIRKKPNYFTRTHDAHSSKNVRDRAQSSLTLYDHYISTAFQLWNSFCYVIVSFPAAPSHARCSTKLTFSHLYAWKSMSSVA